MSGQANEDCVGPAAETAGKASGGEGCRNQAACASGEGGEAREEGDAGGWGRGVSEAITEHVGWKAG